MVDTRFAVSVHIMVSLAYHQDELMNSDSLAKVLKTNPTFIRKLVSRLVAAGLIASFRGKGGGIKISRDPSEITLEEIYAAATSDKALVCAPKKSVSKACPVSCSMSEIFYSVIDGIEAATKSYLAKLHLSDLLKKIK